MASKKIDQKKVISSTKKISTPKLENTTTKKIAAPPAEEFTRTTVVSTRPRPQPGMRAPQDRKPSPTKQPPQQPISQSDEHDADDE